MVINSSSSNSGISVPSHCIRQIIRLRYLSVLGILLGDSDLVLFFWVFNTRRLEVSREAACESGGRGASAIKHSHMCQMPAGGMLFGVSGLLLLLLLHVSNNCLLLRLFHILIVLPTTLNQSPSASPLLLLFGGCFQVRGLGLPISITAPFIMGSTC